MAKQRPSENAISVGEDRWILMDEAIPGPGGAERLDLLLQPVMPLLDLLETHCVAECCGIDAYALWPDDIKGAVVKLNVDNRTQLLKCLDCLIDDVQKSQADVFVSMRLNQFFKKDALVELLRHLLAVAKDTINDLAT